MRLSLDIRDLSAAKIQSVFDKISAEGKRIANAQFMPIRCAEIDGGG